MDSIFKQIYDSIPRFNDGGYKRGTTLSFWLSLIILLINNNNIIYYYFPISLSVCIIGLCLSTNGWEDMTNIFKISNMVQYIFPLIMIYIYLIKYNTIKYKGNQYNIVSSCLILYNIYLYFNNTTILKLYGNNLIKGILTSLVILFLIN
jgi:hypothetical protein